MKLAITIPLLSDPTAFLLALGTAQDKFQELRREEEHTITVTSAGERLPVLAASLLQALAEQYRRDGYLIQLQLPGQPKFWSASSARHEPSDTWDPIVQAISAGRPDIATIALYAIGELVDNIRDHARSQTAVVAADRVGQQFSLAVADTGISIPSSLRAAGVAVADECAALREALRGRSAKSADERGTGLPSVSRLVRQGLSGQIQILSAGARLAAATNGETCEPLSFFWQGTIVHLSATIPEQPLNLYDYLN